ncbi:MAG: MotA/TolQ/ExbB proton channel family protein [Planctomycetes bacterium]|nr:MotA/TolQ/ExbB proton channel family protein [Planctomycetota bacterium]
MWPLLTASILAVALVLDRALVFAYWYQRFDPLVEVLRPLFLEGDWVGAEQRCRRRGPFTRLALAYIQNRKRSKEARDYVLKREGTVALGVLERRLRWLATLAQVSTLLGLLGTFYFMIYRFRPEATASGQIPQAEFYAAIWESFLSTMLGLIIAIPCTVAYHLFEGHVDRVVQNLEVLVLHLEDWRCWMEEHETAALSNQGSQILSDNPKETG